MKNWKDILLEEGFKPREESRRLLKEAISVFLHKYNMQFTSIQKKAIDTIYSGKDTVLISGTASGKTEAAVIPVSAQICKNKKSSFCIYIAPTRALLNDLMKRLVGPLHQMGIQLKIRHGDIRSSLKKGNFSVLLTTPESLDVLLSKNESFLSKTNIAICDEIHQVYGFPRGLQLLFILKRIENINHGGFQRIALSATLENEKSFHRWFRNEDKLLEVYFSKNQRIIEPKYNWLNKGDLENVIQSQKVKKLLIFVNSRRACDNLFLELKDCVPYKVFLHYSSLERESRKYVEFQFRSSEFAICIATTTLELGIDIGSIDIVVLYEPPSTVSSFIQRIGRGGRRSDKTRVIMTPKNNLELLQFCALTTLAIDGAMEEVLSGQFYSVVIQQIFSSIYAKHNKRLHKEEIIEMCKFFKWIEENDLDLILDRLIEKEYLNYEAKWSSYLIGSELAILCNKGLIFSNMSISKTGIQVFNEKGKLATLSLPFNNINIGKVILFAGRYWKIVSIGENRINVQITNPVKSPIKPSYNKGMGLYISSIITKRIKKQLINRKENSNCIKTSEAMSKLREIYRNIPSNYSENSILEIYDHKYIYYTFIGVIENLLLCFLFQKYGYECQPFTKNEGFAICSDKSLDFKVIPEDKSEIIYIMDSSWKKFAQFMNTGLFYDDLPTALKKKEILSQVNSEKVASEIISLKKSSIVKIQHKFI